MRAARRLAGKYTGQLTVEAAGVEVHYATDSPEARRWFWPLYAPGAAHEPGIARVLCEELRPDATFFDVGANHGYFTVLGARFCRAGAVHAFEVDPALAERIPRSLALNQGLGEVFINCVAVADRTGDLVTFSPAQDGNASTNVVSAIDATGGGTTSMRAVTTTLDDYCARTGAQPDLVKMDIEGAEALALPGMDRLLAEVRPTLVLELHPKQIEGFDRTFAEVVNAVLDRGYEVRLVPDYRSDRPTAATPITVAEIAADRPSVVLLRHPAKPHG